MYAVSVLKVDMPHCTGLMNCHTSTVPQPFWVLQNDLQYLSEVLISYDILFKCNHVLSICMVIPMTQLYEHFCQSACPSICLLSHLFHYVPINISLWNCPGWLPMTKVMSVQKIKVIGQRSRSQRSKPNLAVSGLWLQFEFTYGDEMIPKAWCGLGEVPCCFLRSSVKFQGHTAKKNHRFWPKSGVSGL